MIARAISRPNPAPREDNGKGANTTLLRDCDVHCQKLCHYVNDPFPEFDQWMTNLQVKKTSASSTIFFWYTSVLENIKSKTYVPIWYEVTVEQDLCEVKAQYSYLAKASLVKFLCSTNRPLPANIRLSRSCLQVKTLYHFNRDGEIHLQHRHLVSGTACATLFCISLTVSLGAHFVEKATVCFWTEATPSEIPNSSHLN